MTQRTYILLRQVLVEGDEELILLVRFYKLVRYPGGRRGRGEVGSGEVVCYLDKYALKTKNCLTGIFEAQRSAYYLNCPALHYDEEGCSDPS